ncbi:hypothetical protein CLOBOL_02386 [Enterocloster bolteae ATCC BAA-613]|uniref:Uncharacterized protein n=1 Tax=Enterocloster bolteae (strain ATCC BAA-613 / DSM 15670 / CCUG 46953 / JCM 12243 / WAL 16351) TaxID=411902 RepID=A8RP71_ENTBW|nr:hypothetical protein CLOBOL_02386 [Enterocloster bolteae ATCC BAA-613]
MKELSEHLSAIENKIKPVILKLQEMSSRNKAARHS